MTRRTKASPVDSFRRRDLDRVRIIARHPGTCRGCNQPYSAGSTITPVKGLGGSTLWAHWQSELTCAKATDAFVRDTMLGSARNRRT